MSKMWNLLGFCAVGVPFGNIICLYFSYFILGVYYRNKGYRLPIVINNAAFDDVK